MDKEEVVYEVVCRYYDAPLRQGVEVIDEGTLAEVEEWLEHYRLAYRDIGNVYYRRTKRVYASVV